MKKYILGLVVQNLQKGCIHIELLLPFYEQLGLNIEAILMVNGGKYYGRFTNHHCEIYFDLSGIEHCKTSIVKAKFFDIVSRQELYINVEELQKNMDRGLKHDKYERPHLEYRSMGTLTIETIEAFKKSSPKYKEVISYTM